MRANFSLRWNGFGGSLLFAAIAAAGYAPFALLCGPWLGAGGALSAYALLAVAIYLLGVGPSLRRGVLASLLAGVLGAGVLLAAGSLRDIAIGSALILALCRAGVLYPAPFARGLLREALLAAAGLAFAHALLGASVLSVVLAVWGFFLVQSVFFLTGAANAPARQAEIDPFDAAHARANALLEG